MEARKSVLIILNHGVGAVLGLAALLAIGRFVDPRAYGMVGFTLALVNLAGIIARLGFDRAHIKRVSEGVSLADAMATYAGIRTALTGATTLLLVLGALWWDARNGFTDATTLSVVLLMAVYFVALHLRAQFGTTFQALRRTAKAQSLELVENVVRSVLLIHVALLVGGAAGKRVPVGSGLADALGIDGPLLAPHVAMLMAGAYAAAAVASLGWALWIWFRHRYPLGRFDRDLARRYARFAFPMAMLGVVAVLSGQVDQFFIGYFWGAKEVGYYFAAQRIVQVLMMVPLAAGAIFFPLVSELAASGRQELALRSGRRTARLLSLVITSMAAFLLFFPAETLHIFVGDNYVPAATMLAILVVQTWLLTLTLVPNTLIQGFDRPAMALRVGITIAASNILLNLVLIPDSLLGFEMAGLRGEGAAWATLISQGLGLAVALVALHHDGHRRVLPASVALHAGIATVAPAMLWLAVRSDRLALDRVWWLAIASFGTLVAYVSLSLLAGSITQADVRMARELAHPGRMGSYIREEMTRPK